MNGENKVSTRGHSKAIPVPFVGFISIHESIKRCRDAPRNRLNPTAFFAPAFATNDAAKDTRIIKNILWEITLWTWLNHSKKKKRKSKSGTMPPIIIAGREIPLIDLPEMYETDKCPIGVILI